MSAIAPAVAVHRPRQGATVCLGLEGFGWRVIGPPGSKVKLFFPATGMVSTYYQLVILSSRVPS